MVGLDDLRAASSKLTAEGETWFSKGRLEKRAGSIVEQKREEETKAENNILLCPGFGQGYIFGLVVVFFTVTKKL